MRIFYKSKCFQDQNLALTLPYREDNRCRMMYRIRVFVSRCRSDLVPAVAMVAELVALIDHVHRFPGV